MKIGVYFLRFLSKKSEGFWFKELDEQSFLVAENLGIWDDVIAKFLPKSKFFPQVMDNLYEIINASTIPNFSTNVTLPLRSEIDRVSLLILDSETSIDFYFICQNANKSKLKNCLALLTESKARGESCERARERHARSAGGACQGALSPG